jgi:hypothetical protein
MTSHLVLVMVDAAASKRGRKVPLRLQNSVSDRFLADTPLINNYDKQHVNFYFPVIDMVLTNLHERFQGKKKVILKVLQRCSFQNNRLYLIQWSR